MKLKCVRYGEFKITFRLQIYVRKGKLDRVTLKDVKQWACITVINAS